MDIITLYNITRSKYNFTQSSKTLSFLHYIYLPSYFYMFTRQTEKFKVPINVTYYFQIFIKAAGGMEIVSPVFRGSC